MEQLKTISGVPHKERHDDAKPASPSWFVAKINPVSRFIGALILCIPMFVTLDVVSASLAFALEISKQPSMYSTSALRYRVPGQALQIW